MNDNNRKKYDLEERLIEFAVMIFEVVESINGSRAGNHIAGQLVRSGSNPSLHYGEAQSAESRKDFVHKLQILLKELKESRAALKIIVRIPLSKKANLLQSTLDECNELIAIIGKSIKTAKQNIQNTKPNTEKPQFLPQSTSDENKSN